jgi:hypothetical protein
MLTHPIDDEAAKFCTRFGFIASPLREQQLLLLLKEARRWATSAPWCTSSAGTAPAGQPHGDAESRYHGVLAPSSPMRRAIVPPPARTRRRRKRNDSAAESAFPECSSAESHHNCNDPPTAPLTWAQRLKRVFEIDISLCPLCGGQQPILSPSRSAQYASSWSWYVPP